MLYRSKYTGGVLELPNLDNRIPGPPRHEKIESASQTEGEPLLTLGEFEGRGHETHNLSTKLRAGMKHETSAPELFAKSELTIEERVKRDQEAKAKLDRIFF